MAYPNPQDSPRDFLDHLKSFNLDSAVAAFLHKQTRPPENSRLIEHKVQEWCDRMDTLLGKLNRTMGSQPAHQDVCGAVNELCAKTIVDVELQLAQQKESDEAEAKKLVEKRMAAEREEKERQEKIKRMEQELQEMRSVDVDLAPEQHPVQYVQQAAGGDDEEDEDEDEEDEELASESAVDEPQGSSKKRPKRQPEDARKRLPQIVHPVRCAECDKANEGICTGPMGQACDHCWKIKKRCSNGGRRRRQDPAVKEEPKSPGGSVPSKRKMYSTTDARPIGRIDPIDINAHGSAKRQKTTSGGSAHVRFDGVILNKPSQPAPKATRKSTRSTKANSKKGASELFERLGQEFKAISKTCEEISEALE